MNRGALNTRSIIVLMLLNLSFFFSAPRRSQLFSRSRITLADEFFRVSAISHATTLTLNEEIFPMVVEIYLFNFADSSLECSADQVYEHVWGNSSQSIRSIIEMSSYGKVTLHKHARSDGSPTVFGPILLPYSVKDIGCDASPDDETSRFGSLFHPGGFKPEEWNLKPDGKPDSYPNKKLIFMFPKAIYERCGMGGATEGAKSWIARCDRTESILHELGRHLGLDNSDYNPDNLYSDQYAERADKSTPMGSGKVAFGAPAASWADWMPPWAISTLIINSSLPLNDISINLAPVDTMPEDTLLLNNVSLTAMLLDRCSRYQVSYRSKTTIFGRPKFVDAALPDPLNNACLLHRVLLPTSLQPHLRTHLVKIIPFDSSYIFQSSSGPLKIQCKGSEDHTATVIFEGRASLSQAPERPQIPRLYFNSTDTSNCAVAFTLLTHNVPLSTGYGVGVLALVQLQDPQCQRTSASLKARVDMSYFGLSVYPPQLEFDLLNSKLRQRFARILVAVQWDIDAFWTIILAKIEVSMAGNRMQLLDVSVKNDLRPLIARLPTRVDEFYVSCPSDICIAADAILPRSGAFCCRIAFRGATWRSPSLSVRMQPHASYRAMLPYTAYLGAAEWTALPHMPGFGVIPQHSDTASNDSLVFELVEGKDNVLGVSTVPIPVHKCNALPTMQVIEPTYESLTTIRAFSLPLKLSVRLAPILIPTADCPQPQNYTYSIRITDDSTDLMMTNMVHSPLTTESKLQHDVALFVTPTNAESLSTIDNAIIGVELAANETPELGTSRVALIVRQPKLQLRVIRMPPTFFIGDYWTPIPFQITWLGFDDGSCEPRKVVIIVESKFGSERVPIPFQALKLRPNEPRVVNVDYRWPARTSWFEKDELQVHVVLTDTAFPFDARQSQLQSPQYAEITSPFVTTLVVPVDLRADFTPVYVTLCIVAVAAAMGGILVFRWRKYGLPCRKSPLSSPPTYHQMETERDEEVTLSRSSEDTTDSELS